MTYRGQGIVFLEKEASPHRDSNPYRELAAAILLQAIHDMYHPTCLLREQQKIENEALAFIEGIGPFREHRDFLCACVGIAPGAIRELSCELE